MHVANVRLFDAGQQFLKSTVDYGALNGVDDVLRYRVRTYSSASGEYSAYSTVVEVSVK